MTTHSPNSEKQVASTTTSQEDEGNTTPQKARDKRGHIHVQCQVEQAQSDIEHKILSANPPPSREVSYRAKPFFVAKLDLARHQGAAQAITPKRWKS